MSYAQDAAAVGGNTQPPNADHHSCCAPGCPLPGTIADATTGASDWFCALHHGAGYSDQAGISARIGNRRKLLVLAQRLANAGTAEAVPAQVVAWIKAQGRADLLGNGSATCRSLGARMLRILVDECRKPQQDIADPTQPKAKADSWNAAADAARAFLGGLA